ncbi:MAG: exodeoxyribonuclease VII small subunit [Anaerolineae bacterium]
MNDAALTFEQAFAELESIVERLESGDLTLEEMLALFERGQALAARCEQILAEAELKLEQIGVDPADSTSLPLEG